MGLLDSISDFVQNRQGDFTKLDSGGKVFGPGPAILLYGIPSGVTDDEIQDMLQDAAPAAHRKGCRLCRVTDDMLDQSLQDTLENVATGKMYTSPNHATITLPTTAMAIPVLFFSGFQNDEMRSLYDILGKEIYEETAGQASAACAMATRSPTTNSISYIGVLPRTDVSLINLRLHKKLCSVKWHYITATFGNL
jgi:hypothetical protein